MEETILAIAAGLILPKKDFNILSKRNQYLNYSLLGLATILSKKYRVIVFQGDFIEPSQFIELLHKNYDLANLRYPVLLSIPSYYALPWCKEVCKILKNEYNTKIIAGGKWVVGKNGNWLKQQIPQIDIVLSGDGDYIIESAIRGNNIVNVNNPQTIFKELDYSLLYDNIKYQPSIEISRGCGRGCKFCAEADLPRSVTIHPKQFYAQLKNIVKVYKSKDFNLYLQSSTFSFDNEFVDSLQDIFTRLGYIIYWRCTSRIDSVPLDKLKYLSRCGLKVLDLGLESASDLQLLRMGKTSNPKKYLNQAEKILYECNRNNIYVKINILLYSGENYETINETIKWLEKNKALIKGISANSQIIYGYDNTIMNILKNNGSSYTEHFSLEKDGYAYINLSKEIDYEVAKNICLEMSRIVMSDIDYFELKKYGYFARNYTFEEYKKDLAELDSSILPFKRTLDNKSVLL